MPRRRKDAPDASDPEKLRPEGVSPERVPDYEERTVPELRAQAEELGLSGYADLDKDQLIALLRR